MCNIIYNLYQYCEHRRFQNIFVCSEALESWPGDAEAFRLHGPVFLPAKPSPIPTDSKCSKRTLLRPKAGLCSHCRRERRRTALSHGTRPDAEETDIGIALTINSSVASNIPHMGSGEPPVAGPRCINQPSSPMPNTDSDSPRIIEVGNTNLGTAIARVGLEDLWKCTHPVRHVAVPSVDVITSRDQVVTLSDEVGVPSEHESWDDSEEEEWGSKFCEEQHEGGFLFRTCERI
ncbi:hypothetical protein MKZ38_010549 [Zalerion maritima]|uniref:Uncharacterized protein n=1 Tax=Zalerion maritima TaxID=339359 RepID=A0AAD5WLU1_9PEZI|nr:hypothetical protein MKZ38_010549 [Zalerion maritima]